VAPTPTISPRSFSYAKITDNAGSNLFNVGDVFPILYTMKPGTRYMQSMAGEVSKEVSYTYGTVILAGVKNERGGDAKPFAWSINRVRIVNFDSLTATEQNKVLGMFRTHNS
jgi:hypothetical protein